MNTAQNFFVIPIRCLHFGLLMMLVIILLSLGSAGLAIAQNMPIYELPPFDTLTLKPQFGGGSFKMLPLGLRNGLTPSPLPREGLLTVTFADEPDDKYEVEWQAVASIVTYHEAVFAELQQHLRRGAFDAAHGYFDYLFRNAPAFPGLQNTYESMLIAEAKVFLQNGDTQNMTARFQRLHTENKNHAELRQLWSSQVDSQLTALMQHENCDEMRTIIRMFEERYPDNEVGKRWQTAIQQLARNYAGQAEECFAAKQYLETYNSIANARRVLGHPDALRNVEQSLEVLCPRIVVAVSQMTNLPASVFPVEYQLDQPDEPSDKLPVPLTDATIRSRRLVQHDLVEYSGSGIDGGIYGSAIGLFSCDISSEMDTGFEWVLHDDLKWAVDGQPMTAFDLAETLQQLCFQQHDNAGHVSNADDNYMAEQLFRGIDIIDSRTVALHLNRESLFPESRLRVPLTRSQAIAFMGMSFPAVDVPDDQQNWNGPYLLKRFEPRSPVRNQYDDCAFYLRNTNDPLAMSDKPGMLVEQTLVAGSDAMQLLLEGKIDLVEHIPPNRVAAYRLQSELVVGKYAASRVHFLLPNRNKPATSSRTFLRGMLYGLDRTWMLSQLLGDNVADGTVISAPLPKRTNPDDPFGYAYNDRIVPRPYEPKLAVALAVTAYNQVKNRELKKQLEGTGQESAPPTESEITASTRDLYGYLALVPDELVLACPPNDTARNACLMIQQQWRTVGIPVRIVEYRPNERVGRGTDVDFWYVEMTMLEPYIDLELLFGNCGMVTNRSEYIELAMSHVRLARNWQEAVEALESLHRTLYDETTVLPLWQINSHFAHRRELTGVPAEIFRLYDQVEQWRLEERQ